MPQQQAKGNDSLSREKLSFYVILWRQWDDDDNEMNDVRFFVASFMLSMKRMFMW